MSSPHHQPDLTGALTAFLGARGITADQIAEVLGRPVSYVDQQLTGAMTLRVDVTGALAILAGMTPVAVLDELARLQGQTTGQVPARKAHPPLPGDGGALPPSPEGRAVTSGPTGGVPPLRPKRPRIPRPHRTGHHVHRPDWPTDS